MAKCNASDKNRDNSGIFFSYSSKKTYCAPSLEPSHLDGSNERVTTNVYNEEIWKIIAKLSPLPLLIWSTVYNCMLCLVFSSIFFSFLQED